MRKLAKKFLKLAAKSDFIKIDGLIAVDWKVISIGDSRMFTSIIGPDRNYRSWSEDVLVDRLKEDEDGVFYINDIPVEFFKGVLISEDM